MCRRSVRAFFHLSCLNPLYPFNTPPSLFLAISFDFLLTNSVCLSSDRADELAQTLIAALNHFVDALTGLERILTTPIPLS
jgi:predicted membrane chloride channel (bestrophin family)